MLGIPWVEWGFILLLVVLGVCCVRETPAEDGGATRVFDWSRERVFRGDDPDELDDPARVAAAPWDDLRIERTSREIASL